MSNIQVLDCTLRDGGYCNQWRFGKSNIRKVIEGLEKSNIDVAELGFLSDSKISVYSEDVTIYNDLHQLDTIAPHYNSQTEFVVMINYGEYDAEKLPCSEEVIISGIRVAFHKKDMDAALDFCYKIKEKGYKLYIQPMVSMNYSDKEFLRLLERASELMPSAFYIVDSFGTMKKKDLIHYAELARVNLDKDIVIGFHSHNNLQMAFSNAQTLVEYPIERNVMIDASIHGMGRGAGNLNLELFLDYLNNIRGYRYSIKPLITVIDEVISEFYREHPWGYSLPNYLSAVHLIHPNYAVYFSKKDSLTVDAMDDIFSQISPDKRAEFDKEYAEQLYLSYMSREINDEEHINLFREAIKNRKVLLVAAGKSVEIQKDRIASFCKENEPLIICINHDNASLNSDYVFISNLRRFRQYSSDAKKPLILTSNVSSEQKAYMTIKYSHLLNGVEGVSDNAGLMAIRFLINIGMKEIYLAGYDGYIYDSENNYENKEMIINMSNDQVEKINCGMKQVLSEYRKETELVFITDSQFEC